MIWTSLPSICSSHDTDINLMRGVLKLAILLSHQDGEASLDGCLVARGDERAVRGVAEEVLSLVDHLDKMDEVRSSDKQKT